MAQGSSLNGDIVNLRELVSLLSDNGRNGVGTEEKLELLDTRKTHSEILQAWEQTPARSQKYIKQQVLSALGSRRRRARFCAARIVAKIAKVELPTNNWPRLMRRLLNGARSTPKDELCEGTVMCLKHMCDESPNSMRLHASDILQVLRNAFSRRNDNLQLAVASCLESLIPLMHGDLKDEKDSLYMLCDLIREENISEVRGMAFMGLKNAAHFAFMVEYFEFIRTTSFKVLENCLSGQENDAVGIEVIEFWSARAEFEVQHMMDDSARMSLQALDGLLLLYFDCLKRQEGGATMSDDIKNREWTIALAAGASLDTFAKIYGEKVFPKVFKFIRDNLEESTGPDGGTNWRSREAAVCALGSCINRQTCTQEALLSQLDDFLMEVLPRFMSDEHELVRQTTMWTLGRICKFAPRVVPLSDGEVLEIISRALCDEPHIASYGCWCICSLCVYLVHCDRSNSVSRNPIESTAPSLLQTLVAQAIRQSTNKKLAQSCCEAVNHIIDNTHLTTDLLTRLVAQFILRVQQVTDESLSLSYLNLGRNTDLKMGLLSSFYASLWHTINRLNESRTGYIFNIADARSLLSASHAVISPRFNPDVEGVSDELYEDILLTWSAIAENLESDFSALFGQMQLQQIILFPLTRQKSLHRRLREICCGVIGDIYRALEGQVSMVRFGKFTDSVVISLLENVVDERMSISSTQHFIGALADIAICCQAQWPRYMKQCIQTCVPIGCVPTETDFIPAVGDFRCSILDLCRSSFIGSITQELLDHLLLYSGRYLAFILSDEFLSDDALEGTISLCTDILEGGFVRYPYPQPFGTIFGQIQSIDNQSSDILAKVQVFRTVKSRAEGNA